VRYPLGQEVRAAEHDRDRQRPTADAAAPVDPVAPGDAADAALDDDERELFDAVFAPEEDDPPPLFGDGRRPLTNLNGARVLILNASFEPLHVCSLKRAVALLMQEIAERVEDADRVLRSPTSIFAVPSVIRLRRYVKRPHRQRVAFNRKNLFRRDDHTCQYCRARSNDLTLDHVMPRSRGGGTSWENVVACCRRCNALKRDRTPDEAGMSLTRKPVAPAFLFSSAYGLLPDIDPAWEKYLPKRG
jgi:5-methylcytosine-specific restriction endonuclease McrA